MDWLVVGVQWLHVLLGILWFGNALALDIIVIPAINRMSVANQREFAYLVGSRATPIFRVVVPLIIVLGFVRGTVFGPIKSVELAVTTAYGLTWLLALTATVATYVWGLVVLRPAIEALDRLPIDPDEAPTAAMANATNRVKRLVFLELLGFLVIFSCMILMRFGL